jgi:mono/diheme cytochrome c family protein
MCSAFASRAGARAWFAAFTLAAAALLYPSVRDLVLGVELSAAERGYQMARRSGCFDCHGADGSGGVKNPGSRDGEVPGFAGGVLMMWVTSEQDVREYILDGAPERKRTDPRYRQQIEAQLLAMPAYRGSLHARDVDDLVAYLRAVSGLITPADEAAAQGQELALRLGCFHCHGPMGAGKTGNPGSLKGYIPGWWGNDFRELVRNDDELRGWILDGQIPRLANHWLARHFLRRQRVSMPSYRDFISEGELQALMRYVRWVNDSQWQTRPLPLGH